MEYQEIRLEFERAININIIGFQPLKSDEVELLISKSMLSGFDVADRVISPNSGIMDDINLFLTYNYFSEPVFQAFLRKVSTEDMFRAVLLSRTNIMLDTLEEDKIIEVVNGYLKNTPVDSYISLGLESLTIALIRRCLKDSIDIGPYIRGGHTYDQVWEIRMGLVGGVDVSNYLNPKFSPFKMKRMRDAIIAGMEVEWIDESYSELSISMAVDCFEYGFDLIPYIKDGFSDEQLAIIVRAVYKNIDVSSFAIKNYMPIQMEYSLNKLLNDEFIPAFPPTFICYMMVQIYNVFGFAEYETLKKHVRELYWVIEKWIVPFSPILLSFHIFLSVLIISWAVASLILLAASVYTLTSFGRLMGARREDKSAAILSCLSFMLAIMALVIHRLLYFL